MIEYTHNIRLYTFFANIHYVLTCRPVAEVRVLLLFFFFFAANQISYGPCGGNIVQFK